MENVEPTSACVLVFHPRSGLVLVERRKDGRVGLPGGRREPDDRTPLANAARELFEETGARLRSASSILVYQAGPHVCEAFLAVDVADLPDEVAAATRFAAWVDAEVLVDAERSRFPEYCARMFARLAAIRARPWPTEVRRCV